MTNSKQIVVVEDDPSMIQAIKRLLQAAGLPGLTFASAEALLQSGAAAQAACFVLDIHLPGLSGFELQHRLLDMGIRQPVIFITAHDEPSTREAAEAAGAMAFLTKPFPGRSLLGAIRQALERPNGGGHSQGQTGVQDNVNPNRNGKNLSDQ